MRAWAFLLGGLIVWTVHFFGLYATGSVFLTSTTSRVLSLLLTAACLVAAGTLLAVSLRAHAADDFGRWTNRLATLSAAVALLAVLWQGLPALLI